MSQHIAVNVEIKPSDNNGYATWVRSLQTEAPGHVWWKWYGTESDAYHDAEQLGFTVIAISPHTHTSVHIRRTLRPEQSIEISKLIEFRFERV